MVNNEGGRLTRVVVSTPGAAYFKPGDLAEHNLTQLADRTLTLKQHDLLKETLRTIGAEVIAKLEDAGTTVHTLDLSEFAKGTGGPNCLIMPVERDS